MIIFHGISQFEIYFSKNCNDSNLYSDGKLFQCTKTTEKQPYFAVKIAKKITKVKKTISVKKGA